MANGDEDTAGASHFARLSAGYCQRSGVTTGTGFGSGAGLRVHGKIFALLSPAGALILKLPRGRVDALVGDDNGTRFDPRRDGREMREWVVLPPEQEAVWDEYIEEAYTFVSGALGEARREAR